MVTFHVRCDRWCLSSCGSVSPENTILSFFVINSMHSLKDTQFWLCYFLFFVPVLKKDLKLSVNHQFIAPSFYNQITQLIFITDIFRPKRKCTTFFARTLCLSEVSRFLSNFWQLAQGCQVIGEGPGNGFPGPSVQALPLPSRVTVSWPLLPSTCYAGKFLFKLVTLPLNNFIL